MGDDFNLADLFTGDRDFKLARAAGYHPSTWRLPEEETPAHIETAEQMFAEENVCTQ